MMKMCKNQWFFDFALKTSVTEWLVWTRGTRVQKKIKDIPKQSKSFSVAIFHPNLWSIYVESSRILRNSDWFRLQKCDVVPIVLFPVFTIYTSIIWGRKKNLCDRSEESLPVITRRILSFQQKILFLFEFFTSD